MTYKNKRVGLQITTIILLITVVVISACSSKSSDLPSVPTETPTMPAKRSPLNNNSEALNTAQSAIADIEFGFAPLLVEDKTAILIKENQVGEQSAWMAYPKQPPDPTKWTAADSFIIAYAVRASLLDSPRVNEVNLGSFDLSTPVDSYNDTIEHTAAWVIFADRTSVIVDLTPLSTNFAARHNAQRWILTDSSEIEAEFKSRREGVFLNHLQPMTVVDKSNKLYYLLTKLVIFPDRYEFALQIHPVQPADPMTALHLAQGTMVTLAINRFDFAEFQQLLKASDSSVFKDKPKLLTRLGDDSSQINDILDENLYLIWHLVTKLKHIPPEPGTILTPVSTSTPAPSPTSTSTPTATPTNPAMPLSTS